MIPMLRLFLFTILTYAAIFANGQNISRADVLTDLNFLNRAVKYAHPVNYRSVGAVTIDPIVSRVEKTIGDSISAIEFRFILGETLQEIGCVHTNVRKNPTLSFKAGTPQFFPLHVRIINGAIFTVRQPDSLRQYSGRQLLSINGIPTDSLVRKFMAFSASDGGGKAFVSGQMDVALESVIALNFGYPETYSVRFKENTETFRATVKPLTDSLPKMPMPALSNGKNALYINGARALLKVAGFHLSDKRFFRRVRRKLETNSVSDLVLDLRDNTGGNRKAAVVLTKQLIDSTFQYQIVEPKLLHPEMYLSKKGRRQLRLAWIHYHVFDCFKHRHTKDGHVFTYRYRPAAKPFNGKIYVLQNGLTASSSTMVTSWLKQYSGAVFVGSQSGGGYNGNNGGSFPSLVLPASGIELKFPVYRLVLDPDSPDNGGIKPDFEVERSLEDYLQKVDKQLEVVVQLIDAAH